MKFQDIKVDVLMSTYNGEKYLAEQIESLIAQAHRNWCLFIRDDGSSDGTINIINCYTEKYPDKIILFNKCEVESSNIGPYQSFFKLLQNSKSDYAMFCDQDDVWLPNKIEVTLGEILRLEDVYGKKEPILVYTNLLVVNEKLNVVSKSYYAYRGLDYHIGSNLNRLLVQNVVLGCTTIFNAALKNKIRTLPSEVTHDWWLALVGLALGKVSFLDIPPIYYRQHDLNVAGAKKWGIRHFINMALNFLKVKNNYLFRQKQAKLFLKEYENELSDEQRKVIGEFANLSENGFFKRRRLFLKNKYFMSGAMRNLFIILFC